MDEASESYPIIFFCSEGLKKELKEMDEKTLTWFASRLAHQINMTQIKIMEEYFKFDESD